MAARYFCDNCGRETHSADLSVMVISVPPHSETFDVCPSCVGHMTNELKRCREAKERRELSGAGDSLPVAPAMAERSPSRSRSRPASSLQRYGASVLEVPGVRPLIKTASYVAIFLFFFLAVTVLSVMR